MGFFFCLKYRAENKGGTHYKTFQRDAWNHARSFTSRLGEWDQKKISLLEQKEEIDENLLKAISKALKIPVEAFLNFDKEQTINIL